jgi:putative DNA modification/repair radical SAM protein
MMMRSMDVSEKLSILADAAKYDASCASSGSKRPAMAGGIGATEKGICHSYTPDGRCVSLLKILLTNFCIYDCQYCVNRISSDTPRAAFSPEEVVQLTLDFYRRNYIEGLFLSSGVLKNPDYTMELVIRVAQTLREQHKFGGYIHLKAVAGASPNLLVEAGKWADRLSANIELPTEKDLGELAPQKSHGLITSSMQALASKSEEMAEERAFLPAGQSTQMIVGATASDDRAILLAADSLYRRYKLRRVYYSAFSPIPSSDRRLPSKSPPLMREHRLYQADWLVRFYGFEMEELVPAEAPELSLTLDPKLSWALRHRDLFPVDINRAPREQLLRVPGLGVRNVERILRTRRFQQLRLADLKTFRVNLAKVSPFIETVDHAPVRLLDSAHLIPRMESASQPVQLSLFEAQSSALSGEL